MESLTVYFYIVIVPELLFHKMTIKLLEQGSKLLTFE